MRRDIKTKTGQLLTTSDLTVAAPIRPGLVPALDAVSYKTRVERLLRLLQLGRLGQHEFEFTRVLADAVERVGLIHAVRVAVIEPQNLVMLSVTFDGAWEPYMRVVWQKVARLLDLIFCNTEGYVYGWESSFDEWMVWLRRHQVSTPFLYAQPHGTVGDGELRRGQEWVQRQHADRELTARKMGVLNADLVEATLSDGDSSDPRFPGSDGYRTPVGGNALISRQSVRALAALHRLTDMYLPGTHDGWVLHRAARETLPRLVALYPNNVKGSDSLRRFKDALEWLVRKEPDPPPARQPPRVQDQLVDVLPKTAWPRIQAGILEPLSADDGVVLLLQFGSAAAFGHFLAQLPLTHHDAPFNDDGLSVNVALSAEGLRLAGFTDDELRAWPEAFYEGMARRAGLLGDVRLNHPRNWRMPPRLKDGVLDEPAPPSLSRVELAEVHALLHVRLKRGTATTPADARKALQKALENWTLPAQRLAVQWLRRQKNAAGETVEHFGWRDAQTGPVFDLAQSSPRSNDHSHVGEALCGYANAVDHRWPAAGAECSHWLQDGSFLVVRKLRQDVAALDAAVTQAVPALDADTVRAKLMGRWHDKAPADHAGLPLLNPPAKHPGVNDFSFSGDQTGEHCPLHAHIRLGNQRLRPGSLTNEPLSSRPHAPVRPPKLLRRGMSFGPSLAEGPADAERGLFFMAYNASLCEQFEVMQRWLSGANSSGGDSAQGDPLLAVATPGQDRTYLFHHEGRIHRVVLEKAVPLNEEPQPLVRLEWGAYWFAPALPIVAEIAARARSAGETPLWSAARGEQEIQRLLALERQHGAAAALPEWKRVLEDPESLVDHAASSIWAAIRELHGGYLKCAFGVLVADPDGIDRMLRDEALYTARGYLQRMRYSFGPIFLGCDAGSGDGRYERESAHIVDKIRDLPVDETYLLARQLTDEKLRHLRDITEKAVKEVGETEWRLAFDARELLDELLGKICTEWFGLRDGDGQAFATGGLDASLSAGDRPRNPGHFATPSRYFFQPHPGPDVERVGQAHGQALRRVVQSLLDARDPVLMGAPLTRAILDNPLCASEPGYTARTVVGVIMGFVPTVDGTLRRLLAEWLREGSFWRLRGQQPLLPDFHAAWDFFKSDFIRAIQMRGAPELLWRTAAADHRLGQGPDTVAVHTGDRVVAGLMSATQCRWRQGSQDYHALFGGDRSAPGAPTHACPGTNAALALMAGFLAALLESDLPLRPGVGGLSFEARGKLPVAGPGLNAFSQVALLQPKALKTNLLLPLFGDKKFQTPVNTLALGDSWLTPGGPFNATLTLALGRFGYVNQINMADKGWSLIGVADLAAEAATNLPDIDMVVIDGGGNDVHYESCFADPQNPHWKDLPQDPERRMLDDLLTGKKGSVTLNDKAVDHFINDYLKKHMRRALTGLTDVQLRKPVMVVAYDYPIPDGRGLLGLGPPWLAPHFRRVGLDESKPAHLKKSRAMMRDLIRALNDMIAKLIADEFAGKQVYAIDLTNTLDPNEHIALWRDELHPSHDGFRQLAIKFDTEIRNLPAAVPKPLV